MGLSKPTPLLMSDWKPLTPLLKEGLWKGKYAGRNHHEYFAEGAVVV